MRLYALVLAAIGTAVMGWLTIDTEKAAALPPDRGGIALAVNDQNVVVGGANTAIQGPGTGPMHASRWDNGSMLDLGTLGGPSSLAVAINDRGDIAGWSDTAGGSVHAFLWRDGQMIDLSTLGGGSSAAAGIDSSGDVTGISLTSAGADDVFVWRNGHMLDTGPLPQGTIQAGLPGAPPDAPEIVPCPFAGVVAGVRSTAGGALTAFVSSPPSGPLGSQAGDRSTVDIPAPTDAMSVTVSGCNRQLDLAGTIVNITSPFDTPHAELWRHGTPIALQTGLPASAPSFANGIADNGDVVGQVGISAAVWNRQGPPVTLNPPSFVDSSSANALNDRGTIVGGGFGYPNTFPIIWTNGVAAVLPTPISTG